MDMKDIKVGDWIMEARQEENSMGNSGQDVTGTRQSHDLDGVNFCMRLVLAGISFPTGVKDSGTARVDRAFWIGETAVTYELWDKVYNWATHSDRGVYKYMFANAGQQGGSIERVASRHTGTNQHPVTRISWGDAVAWLNALTEYHNEMCETNYEMVYRLNNEDLRNAKAANENEVTVTAGNGFRLPTSMEWELAARWIGTKDPGDIGEYGHGKPLGAERLTYKADGAVVEQALPPGYYWTPGKYASGAVEDCGNLACWDVNPQTSSELKEFSRLLDNEVVNVDVINTVAWYQECATQPVGQKTSNALGLYDMSGNVSEWCFDAHKGVLVTRGGSWLPSADYELQVGDVTGFGKALAVPYLGFRIVRTM